MPSLPAANARRSAALRSLLRGPQDRLFDILWGNGKQAFASTPLLFGALSLGLLLAALYTFSIGLRATRGASITGDEPFYLLTTQSLLQDGDLDLRQQYERESYRSFFDHPDGLWQQSVPLANGQVLSPHEPGLSVLVVPGFVAGGLRGVQVQLLLIAALTFALTYVLVALETGRPLLSWLVTAACGLSATAFVYATEVYPEVPAALCIILSLLVLRQDKAGVREGVCLAVLVSALAWLSEKYVPLGCVLAVFFLLRASWPGRGWFMALSAVSGVIYVALHLAVYDHLTAYSINTVYEGASSVSVLEDHLAFGDRVYRLYGLFIDRRFGIGRWAPLLLVVLPSLPLLIGRERVRLAVASLIVLQICIATFLAITMMGFWFPGRTLMTVLPLFSLVIVTLLLRLPVVLRWGVVVLGGLSLLITAALVQATRSGEVRLAVDPFEMDAQAFQTLGRLFPNFQTWSATTVVLTSVWLAGLVIAGGWALAKNEFVRQELRRLVRSLRRPMQPVPGHSSAAPPP